VRHSGGESQADLVVGADGLRSVVRSSVWPDAPAPQYAGYTSWRMITPPVRVGESCESWGRGERFGYARLPDGRVYCYAAANAPEGGSGDGLAGLRRRFGGWHDPIPALLEAADPDAVLHHDLYELPPLEAYASGRVALVGHEPGLSEIASYLLAGTGHRGVDLEMKKGGIACLGVDGEPGPGTAWLRWLATPRILRGL